MVNNAVDKMMGPPLRVTREVLTPLFAETLRRVGSHRSSAYSSTNEADQVWVRLVGSDSGVTGRDGVAYSLP